MKLARFVIGAGLLLAFLHPTLAKSCVPTTSPAYTIGVDGVLVFYFTHTEIPDRHDQFPSWYIYQETNEIDGFQRRDDVWDDTCGGQIESDTIVI